MKSFRVILNGQTYTIKAGYWRVALVRAIRSSKLRANVNGEIFIEANIKRL